MSRAIIPIVLLTFIACSGKATPPVAAPVDVDLQVTSATARRWAGGPAPICGIDYNVKLTKPTGIALDFEQVWVGDRDSGKSFPPEVWVVNQVASEPTVAEDVEQFFIQFSDSFPCSPANKTTQEKHDVPEDFPEEFTSGAILWYSAHGGPQAHVIVESFEELQRLAYP